LKSVISVSSITDGFAWIPRFSDAAIVMEWGGWRRRKQYINIYIYITVKWACLGEGRRMYCYSSYLSTCIMPCHVETKGMIRVTVPFIQICKFKRHFMPLQIQLKSFTRSFFGSFHSNHQMKLVMPLKKMKPGKASHCVSNRESDCT
jgi:hypothetical protein